MMFTPRGKAALDVDHPAILRGVKHLELLHRLFDRISIRLEILKEIPDHPSRCITQSIGIKLVTESFE